MTDRPKLPPELVRLERGDPGEEVRQPPLDWSPDDCRGFFVQQRPVRHERIEESEDLFLTDTDIGLGPGRDAVINEVLGLIDQSWENGGVAGRSYGFAAPRGGAPRLDRSLALGLLTQIADEKLLPAVLVGASTDYLADEGIELVPAQALADSIYSALQGGAYSESLPLDAAARLTRSFVDALLGYAPPEACGVFALDPGFSSYFERVHWDMAYFVVNLHELWAVLICATDTD